MAAVKRGLLDFPASELAGEIVVVGIGLEQSGLQIKAWDSIKRMVADAGMVREWLPARPGNAHKGTFGTALVIAGSINYTGAALLSGKAAYRVGAGLVTLAIPSPLHSALAGQFPEATWLLLPHEIGVIAQGAVEVIRENLERPTAMLLGPGFGTEDTTKEFITRLIGAESARHRRSIGFIPPAEAEHASGKNQLPPMVIDADGLKLLAGIPNWHANLPEGMVLTPHPGEMSVLTGLPVEEIQADRLGVAEKYANEWRHIVVLKGANTVIAKPGGDTVVIPVASAALARAGTGDVLAGLITGLRAQGVEGFQAAVSGCWIHAQAGLLAAEYLGNTASVLAGDVLDSVAEVLSELILGDEAKNRSE
jgi:NAD(P)H-hydrate epimerase